MRARAWSELELAPADFVALGQFLERLRVVERRLQQRLTPKRDVPATADLLAALRDGVAGRPSILARHLGIPPHLVSVRLGRLRDQGLVTRDADGCWRPVAGSGPITRGGV